MTYRFLFTCWPFEGHIIGPLVIAAALRERGHDVAIYSGESVRAAVEGEGCAFYPFTDVDEEAVYEIVRLGSGRPNRPLGGGRENLRTLRKWVDVIPKAVADLRSIIEDWRPDVLMTDLSMWAPTVILREAIPIPVAGYQTLMGPLIPGPDAPPWGLGLPPPRTRRQRAVAGAITKLGYVAGVGFRRGLNKLRRDYGLSPLDCTLPTLTGRLPLHLVGSLAELDYNRRDLPESVHYVGPCIWRPPSDAEAAAWLNAIPAERPWVHVNESTLHYGDPLILRAAAQGLADSPLEVILTAGRHRDLGALGLGELAPNMHLAEWISHRELMPRCAVMVTAGGTSTILSSLQAGVPLVVVPTHWDKPDNAQRVVEAGVGVRLATKRCTPAGLRAAVEEVLSDPAYRENAQRVAELLARAPGPPRAAELLEELALTNAAVSRAAAAPTVHGESGARPPKVERAAS